jgi:hypothetical protein
MGHLEGVVPGQNGVLRSTFKGRPVFLMRGGVPRNAVQSIRKSNPVSSEGVVRGLERGAAVPHPKARLAILDARGRLAQLAGAQRVASSRAHAVLACLAIEIFRQRSAMHVALHEYNSACHPVLVAQHFFINSPVVDRLQSA